MNVTAYVSNFLITALLKDMYKT